MASISRRTGGRIRRSKGGTSSAERVECCDDLITDILSKVSTTDVIKMSRVSKRWRTLIFNTDFAHTHFKNRHRESILCLADIDPCILRPHVPRIILRCPRLLPKRAQFRSFNSQPGFSVSQKRRYTLVFDSHSNSWYEGTPLRINLNDYPDLQGPLFFNGVIYCIVGVYRIDDQELGEIRDVDALFRDGWGRLYMIVGFDVNQDQWGFSIFIPSTVGSVYCLIEWEGNLLVCAASGDGQLVLWILDTEHKRWIRERDLNLSRWVGPDWEVFASGGVVWFTRGYNSVKVYHMKNRHWSTYRLDDALAPQKKISGLLATFEPTLLSF